MADIIVLAAAVLLEEQGKINRYIKSFVPGNYNRPGNLLFTLTEFV